MIFCHLTMSVWNDKASFEVSFPEGMILDSALFEIWSTCNAVCYRLNYFGMWPTVVSWVASNVSNDLIAFIFRSTIIWNSVYYSHNRRDSQIRRVASRPFVSSSGKYGKNIPLPTRKWSNSYKVCLILILFLMPVWFSDFSWSLFYSQIVSEACLVTRLILKPV